MWSQPKTTRWTNATGGEQFERLYWQDIKEQDWNSVESHLASNFVGTSPKGATDKAQFLAAAKDANVTGFSLSEFSVTDQGPDVIVTYLANIQGEAHGKPIPAVPFRLTAVWQQQKKGWTCVLRTWATSEGSPH